MRLRTDGKHKHRVETIERAAEFWDCNKTVALLKSVEFTHRMDANIRKLMSRDDLTVEQKREFAEILTIPNTYSVEVTESTCLSVE